MRPRPPCMLVAVQCLKPPAVFLKSVHALSPRRRAAAVICPNATTHPPPSQPATCHLTPTNHISPPKWQRRPAAASLTTFRALSRLTAHRKVAAGSPLPAGPHRSLVTDYCSLFPPRRHPATRASHISRGNPREGRTRRAFRCPAYPRGWGKWPLSLAHLACPSACTFPNQKGQTWRGSGLRPHGSASDRFGCKA
jgi:hypothetical protein